MADPIVGMRSATGVILLPHGGPVRGEGGLGLVGSPGMGEGPRIAQGTRKRNGGETESDASEKTATALGEPRWASPAI